MIFSRNFFDDRVERLLILSRADIDEKLSMHCRVIAKNSFFEQFPYEQLRLMKYQYMCIFRIKIQFSIQI